MKTLRQAVRAGFQDAFADIGIHLDPRPFLKWAGGKRQLLPELLARMPETFKSYHEPFLGGGALYFATGRVSTSHLSDLNAELVETWQVVRDNVGPLIDVLGKHEAEYLGSCLVGREDRFYAMRAIEPETPLFRAARFIFLNRTCYNGLYRVNRKGQFNAPHGKYAKPMICDAENLRAVSARLRGAFIEVRDFEGAAKYALEGDFVYFDPPYVPTSKTSSFTGFTAGGFGAADQERLARTFTALASRGVLCMLSNADAPRVRELYADHHIHAVTAKRAINSKGERRGAVGEVIVTSYRPSAVGHRPLAGSNREPRADS